MVSYLKKLNFQFLSLLISIFLIFNSQVFAAKQSTADFANQAKVLEYLLNNIIWPEPSQSEDVNFCILGNTPLDGFNLIHGRIFHNKPVQLHAVNTLNSNECQVVFVSKSEKNNVTSIIKQLEGQPVLTISDLPNFAQQGGGVNLFIANEQPALMLNTHAIRSQKLEISKEMLKILTIIPDVEPENDENNGESSE